MIFICEYGSPISYCYDISCEFLKIKNGGQNSGSFSAHKSSMGTFKYVLEYVSPFHHTIGVNNFSLVLITKTRYKQLNGLTLGLFKVKL